MEMNKLPLHSIRLLTSSQVITSPSSVVKELVENAFDAGATTLDVKLDKFGLEKIEVRDNGCGIKQGDTEFMAQRYYTSKISKHEDLLMLETYGFRGEALGSLCQVSDVCIITRTVEDAVAVLYTLDHNGKVCSTKLTHDGIGTTVVASNLFKNFPVRKQSFQNMKKSKEELKKVEELLMAYGLIIPVVRITLRINKNLIWQKNKSSDMKTALVDVFGINIVNQLEYFEYCDDDLQFTVQCFVPKIDSDPHLMWRSSDERSFIFINKRFVIWKELSQILKKHCVSKNKEASSGKYPLCVVSVCLSSHDVDANIEPNKTKVIINHKEEVLEVLAKELNKIYDGNELQAGADKEIHDTHHDEGIDLDQTREVRPQETSEILSNETALTPECERIDDAELTSERTASIEILGNRERPTAEVSNQPQNTDESRRPDLLNLRNVNEAVDDCTASIVANDDVNSNDDVIAEVTSASIQNDRTSYSYCKDKENINLERTKNVSTTLEEQNSLNKSNDLDKLLDDFINDSENLDDSLLDIDIVQPNEAQWSKGQGLTDKSGKEVEPVKLLHPSVKMNQENTKNGKRKHGFDKDCSSSNSDRPSKKNKKHSLINGQSTLTSVLQSPRMSRTTTRKRKTKEVSFELSSLKQLAARERSSVPTNNDDIQLIKRLDPWGVWLVHKKRKLYILNPYRIQELLLYKRLLATHILPKEKLGKAIVVDERILGGPSRYSLLKKLVFKNCQDDNLRICCDDKRLVANGFEITGRLDEESGEVSLSLVKMNTTIPYFGVSDIVELLDLIKDNNPGLQNGKKHDLASCRTSKVCNFLKDEVARISRSLPSRMSNTDIVELLKNMNEQLTTSENICVHNRPLLYHLTSY